jgi:hypothetical protein
VSEQERRYISYLLRLWQIESQGRLVWQASLEDSRTGKRKGFVSVDALLAFLRQAINEDRPAIDEEPRPREDENLTLD